ncbi:MAG: TadE family protein [Candidatus Korobacteraceae bacterium]
MRNKLCQSFAERSSRPQKVVGQVESTRRRLGWMAATEGNAITEFAFVLPLFVLMLCATMDMARLFYAETTLQNAVRAGGRYAITGNHAPNPQNPNQTLSRVNSILLVTQQAAMGLNVSNVQISSLVGGAGSAGGPGDTVTLSLTTNVQLLTPIIGHFFPNGQWPLTVSVSFLNEAFPPGQTT